MTKARWRLVSIWLRLLSFIASTTFDSRVVSSAAGFTLARGLGHLCLSFFFLPFILPNLCQHIELANSAAKQITYAELGDILCFRLLVLHADLSCSVIV